ncbi:MAG: cyclic nucleotide-binding domain-containing protein [Desulfobacterales bacterium]
MTPQNIHDVLAASEFFKGFDTGDIEKVAAICEVRACAAGGILFQQGDLGEHLFVICDGLVHLERSMSFGNRKGNVVIETLGKSRVLGCWSTLINAPHIVMSTAVCQRPTNVLVMQGVRLRALMTSNIALGFNILERLCYLLRDRIQAAYGALDKI